MKKIKRIQFLDEIRGFCIIFIILYHTFYDIEIIFNLSIPFYDMFIMDVIRDLFAGAFIFMSGISCNLSSNNIKNGFSLLGIGALISFAVLFVPIYPIYFGILHFMGLSTLLYVFFKKIIEKIPRLLGMITGCGLFLLLYKLPKGYIGVKNIAIYKLPKILYKTNYFLILGFTNNNFASSDYYPLLPWIFVFFVGVLYGRKFLYNENPKWYKLHTVYIAKIGKHSLLIYLLHQPIIFPILNIIKWLI